jgi:uncharacterized C2H2 Zn-finger protein
MWWLLELENKGEISRFTLPQLMKKLKESGVKFERKRTAQPSEIFLKCPGSDDVISDEECKDKRSRELFYKCPTCDRTPLETKQGSSFKDMDRIKKMLAEMDLHTSEGKAGRPRIK